MTTQAGPTSLNAGTLPRTAGAEAQVLKSLQGPAGRGLARRVLAEARIETRRGRSISLFLRERGTPALTIRTGPDGRIRVEISPAPGENRTQAERVRRFNPQSLILSRPEGNQGNWRTFSEVLLRAALEKSHSWLNENHPDCVEPPDQYQRPQAEILSRTVAERLLRHNRAGRDTVTKRLDQAIAGMTDPLTRKLAAQQGREVNLHRYNLARMGAENLRQMEDECPGALCWAMWRRGGRDMGWCREQGFPDIESPQEARRQFLAYLEHRGLNPGQAHTGERIRRTLMRKILRIDQTNGSLPHSLAAIHGAVQGIAAQDLDPQAVQDAARRTQEQITRSQNRCRMQTAQAQDELLHLADPQAYRIARRQGWPVTPQGMLIARMGDQHMRHLERTNPGALSWANLRLRTKGPILHPGQLIKMAREQTVQDGIRPGEWRTLAVTSRSLMRTICTQSAPPERYAFLISAIHQAQARPSRGMVQMLTDEYMPEHNPLQNQRAITLAIRESARRLEEDPRDQQQNSLQNQFTQVRDYCEAMAQDGRPVNSRTWAGIQKKSRDWHQETAIRNARSEWERTLRTQGRQYPAWSSLIPTPRRDGEFTITHLGTQKELFQESGEMVHCVHYYTPQCQTGRSRIFSIMIREQRIATGEIRLRQGEWHSVQVRGKHNVRAAPGAERAMERLARDYTRAWQRGARHREWTQSEPGQEPEE